MPILALLPAVLHEDSWCIAIDKPAGLLSVPGRGPDKQDCLAHRLQQAYPDARVVHRLDMATSGIWLAARGIEMQRALGRAFERREVDKRYIAVVHGRMAPPSAATTAGAGACPGAVRAAPGDDAPASEAWGEIDLPLAADWPRRPRQQVDLAHGRPSQTRWRILGGDADRTLVELLPLTGRTHQLRVHLAALGHPILGDALYAPPEVQAMAPRLMLHAWALRLAHPATGARLSIDCPAPFVSDFVSDFAPDARPPVR